ncbi:hypothetical protein LX64_03943 [Chitinophaga skermanii]|uniref:Long-subunit fatty acid transport protein n=1 Tax=Chitinophaga skermanii TaxID=331697 RepID=A0A327QCK9_9BACT|nr:hypothetical protein [Chitinophaga skermanii]RAJ01725.1 hypothetical protein LX64_03943 [Chitinophaga skermanii]
MHWTKASIICLLSTFFVLAAANSVTAQNNSPYSRYGIGELNNNQNAANRGMGGVSLGYTDAQVVNFVNPASYSKLLLTTFDVGVEGGVKTLSNQSENYRSGLGTISYLQLGVPIKRNWGMNFGLRPMSTVSYDISTSQERTFFDTLKVPVVNQYEGSGGIYQAYVGTGFAIGGFSAGVNVGYLFGNITNSTKALFPATSGITPSARSVRQSYSSFFYNVGIQYSIKLNKDMALTIGATGSTKQNLTTKTNTLEETLYYDASSNAYGSLDTSNYTVGAKGTTVYPATFGVGIMLAKNEKFQVGVDFNMGKWDDFRKNDQKDSVGNAWKLAIGGQVTPNARALTGYGNRITYRAGGFFGRDYIKLDGQNLPIFGVTVGAGLPVRRYNNYTNQYTVVNVAFEAGRRGNSSSTLKEASYRVVVGFTLSDIWFRRNAYR